MGLIKKAHYDLKLHKHEIFFNTFCKNWIPMVPRACNTRYAQPAFKSFPRMLSVWWNRFHVCSACASYDFRKLLKNTKLKCKFWPKIIENLKSRLGTHLKGPKWEFWTKTFFDSSPKNLVPRMLSHRENVQTSKFWQKSKEKNQIFFSKIDKGHIRFWVK